MDRTQSTRQMACRLVKSAEEKGNRKASGHMSSQSRCVAGEEGCELSVRRSWGLVLAPMVLGKLVNLLQLTWDSRGGLLAASVSLGKFCPHTAAQGAGLQAFPPSLL